MERVKVRTLRMGQRTPNYRVDEDAKVDGNIVRTKVTFHDGGSAIREWDHPDIEIEVEDGANH